MTVFVCVHLFVECLVGCEDCGEHAAIRCINPYCRCEFGDPTDLVYIEDPRDLSEFVMPSYREKQFAKTVAYFRDPVVQDLNGVVRDGRGLSLLQAQALVARGIAAWVEEPRPAAGKRWKWAIRDTNEPDRSQEDGFSVLLKETAKPGSVS